MKTNFLIATTLLASSSTLFAATHPSDAVFTIQQASSKVLVERAAALESSLHAFCDANSHDVSAVKTAWQQTMAAWMQLQGQQRGPQAALDKAWNVQFWPDKKDTTGRKMLGLVRQDGQVTRDDILQASVTVQGLGSIEWLLYDSRSPLTTDKAAFCRLSGPISQALSYNVGVIDEAWQSNPWLKLDDKHWTSEYVSMLSHQIEYSVKKMSRPLAKVGKPRPYFAESWRSTSSLANLGSNIDAIANLYYNGGLEATLRAKGHQELAQSLSYNIDQLVEHWPRQDKMFDLLKTKQGYQKVLMLSNQLELVDILIKDDVAIALGVVVGFNSTDGD
ncbi:imelysin family protein [Vibrio sp. SCSIO 43136]|uniref:imelysin family protein n=1 Tax=Vibrio sp. SCSIO 43136 TaxID=2819101 RepID=UPI002075D0D0|nr:imelysin family protein [Vibrio sp. SCSIO 43136]USD66391.1 iron-regulated protein A [Vibrio sp. SCSIO 43136]